MKAGRVILLSFLILLLLSQSTWATPTGSGSYSASDAAYYADLYATSPNTNYYKYYIGNDCANFVSQALRAGGWPYANFGSYSTDPYSWYYDNNGTVGYGWTYDDTHSNVWSVARSLYTFIVLDSNPSRGYNATATPYSGTTSDSYPDNTSIGDPIFFDWTGDAVIDHSTIYVANGTDPDSGYSGALSDSHSTNRYHAIWSLSYYNAQRNTTKIYPLHLYSSF